MFLEYFQRFFKDQRRQRTEKLGVSNISEDQVDSPIIKVQNPKCLLKFYQLHLCTVRSKYFIASATL